MTLKEALKKVTKENRMYFNYKFPDTRFNQTIQPKNEEEFLISVGRKTMNGFINWEKTPEYANLVALYLQSKMIDDIYKIYDVVRVKALEGDDKSITTFLKLNKEINTIVKAGRELIEEEVEEDDGLIV
ncbi:hypothetical protein CN417_27985 [Bacillus thuringiensis]|uniref:hypothetical protein n=1 Tax=Bacillus cereus group TaxID=86661 RepID=UPI000BF491EF|nr:MULTISPECIES: hypothetical protein [Bacillus cereus group]PEV02463.1 hypothetical protein CN417_27985 [Bacillus thuringiensis]PEY13462.1 hypothetical protein CN331_27305 [Bacillus cereus]PFC28763.1 hypothetical protein CN299_19090 [Bacillus thuringiensis]PHF60747.1 hypothetical protein COI40_09775 [Bacillus wiedmannii]PHF91527.1 hypothetical protein COI45_22630 [Bacillus wiedmannii]